MTRAPQVKAVIAVGMLFFLVEKAFPQISILSKPASGGVEMSEVSQWGGYVQNFFRVTGVSPDYYAYRILPMPGSTGIYSGSALASKGLVSGAISIGPSYGVALRGGSRANSAMDIFADVVPESKVLVKINASMSINWVGPIMDNRVGFGFDALVGEDNGDGLNRPLLIVTGGLSRSTLCVSAVSPPASSIHEEGGKIYYKLGTISLDGVGGIESPANLAVSADYNVGIGDISAYYIGPALTILDGNMQTGIVGNLLPKALVVKVADGETGTVPPDVPITFTIVEPTNGAKFSNDQTSITDVTENGLAAVKLTLGSAAGNYTIKATCPAAVCTSGAKEVVFLEKAVTVQQATKLTEMFCDGAHFYGQKLSNPLRVKALNLYTNKGEEGLAVTFKAKVGSPEGIIHTENTTTGPNGLASTDFTLGSALGTYTVIANCAQCLAGPTVECLVRGMYPPNAKHDSPEVGLNKRKRGVNIAVSPEEVYPQGTGGSPVESIVEITGASPNTSFTAQVVAGANTGGHQHHDAGRPKGNLAGDVGTVCTGPSPITCTTAQNGYARLKYTSSEVGGWDNILIKMSTGEEGDAIIKVRVPGLMPLAPSTLNYISSSGDAVHPNFLYAAPALVEKVQKIATAYQAKYGGILSLNDMSLINGGFFDVGGKWAAPHVSHRIGMDVDFNTSTYYRERGKLVKVKDLSVPELLSRIKTVISDNNLDCVDVKEETIHIRCK